jgi:hypothetical protein
VDDFLLRPNANVEFEYTLVGKDLLTNVLMLDIGYRLQTFTIELQSAAFAFLLADQQKTQTIVNHVLGKRLLSIRSIFDHASLSYSSSSSFFLKRL